MAEGRPQDISALLAEAGIEFEIPSDHVAFQYPIAAHLRWDEPDRLGVVTYKRVGLAPPAPPLPNLCERQRLLDLMGFGRTGTDGSVVLHLREFVCWEEWKIGPEDQVWVVATPRSSEPVFLTHVVQIPPLPHPSPPDEVDMQIRVFTWDPAGHPKAKVFFTWRAVLVVSVGSPEP